jgi:hypothetical protein
MARSKSRSKVNFISGSLTMNILRVSLLLIFFGLFMPIGCDSSGLGISMGILGKGDAAMGFGVVQDVYAFVFLGVFVVAILGILYSFMKDDTFGTFLFAAGSFILALIILVRFRIYFDFSNFAFYIKIFGNTGLRVDFQIGGYLMIIGFLGAGAVFILNKMRIIK